MAAIRARGPQVVLEGYARTVARGGVGKTMRDNIQAMDALVIGGQVADGNTVDGTSRNGGQPYDVVVAQFPHEPLQAYEIPAPLLQGLGGGHSDPNNIKDWGAIVDGQSHPLSQRYSTLAQAQAVFPHATSLNDEIDWCAIQAAVNALEKVIYIPGMALINRPVVSTALAPLTILGDGVNVSALVQTTAGQDGWQHTSTLGFQLFGMTLSCNGIGGTALKLDFGTGSVSQVTLRDVYIVGNIFNPAGGGQLSNYWHDGIYCKNPSIMQLDHIWILGSNGGYLGNMGDAIYLKCRVGPPSGSFDVGLRDSRLHSYQRGMVIDSINDATGNPTAVNLQGIMLDRVNYGSLMQFVTVIGSCLELVLSKCQGAGFGSVVQADRANTVTIRDGLFFASAAGSQGIQAQMPQDMISVSGGSNWWIKDNEFILSPTAAVNYIFSFSNNFQRGAIRDNLVYITASSTAAGFANIAAGSVQIYEAGTTFANWNAAWPLWTNANVDSAAGNNVPAFQTVVARGQPTSDQYASQGSVIGWNYGGAGARTSFINSRAVGVGGFEFYSTLSSSGATPDLLSTLTADGDLFLFGKGVLALTCNLDAAVPTTRAFGMRTNGFYRWLVYADNAAEPNDGSNTGSNFGIGRYNDAGNANGTPLTISRATGVTTLSGLAVAGQSGFNATAPIAKPVVVGAWGGNTAGKALSQALHAYGLIQDNTSA